MEALGKKGASQDKEMKKLRALSCPYSLNFAFKEFPDIVKGALAPHLSGVLKAQGLTVGLGHRGGT